MKTSFLTTLCILFFSFTASAQIWLELGPKANFGPSGFYNSALIGNDQHDYSLNLAYSYGLAMGLNFGDRHGLNFEGLTGTYFQDFVYRPNTMERFRNNIEWEVYDLLAVYRFYPQSGMFLELGGKYTIIDEITQTSGIVSIPVAGMYEENYTSGIFGIGAFLSGSEVMVIKSNLRMEYGLTDLVTAEGMKNGYPSVDSDLMDQGSTTPFRVSFGLEISFGVGGIAQGACGRRGFVLGTRYQ